eukprot:260059_1
MCTNQTLRTWIEIASCPITDRRLMIPTGIDANNYIVIDGDACIYQYNIDNDKWTIKINHFNTRNPSCCALDANKQILILLDGTQVAQIQVDNTDTITHCETNPYTELSIVPYPKCILLNNSLFIIGSGKNTVNSIMKWDFKNKKMTKFSDTYKKKYIGDFGMVYNDKQNCLLIFGG